MPSISAPYILTKLPRKSLVTSNSGSRQVSLTFGEDSSVYLGISGGSVSSYVLKPTPQLIWSYSVSPDTSITAIYKLTNEGEEDTIWFATIERKKFLLIKVKKLASTDQETAAPQENKISLEAPSEIADLKASKSSGAIYVVFKNSTVSSYASLLDGSVFSSAKGKSSRTVIYSKFISREDISTGELGSEDGPQDGAVLLVSKRDVGRKAIFEVRLVGLNGDEAVELYTNDVEIKDGEEFGMFEYRDGALYRYISTSSILKAYSIVDSHIIFSIKIESIKPDPNGSILPVGKRNILISQGSEVILFDTTYHTVLNRITVDSAAELLSYDPFSSQVVGIMTVDSASSVIGLTVDGGNGSLLESIGKGVSPTDNKHILGLCNVLFAKNMNVHEFSNALRDSIISAQSRANDILRQLKQFKDAKDVDSFQFKLVAYMKGREWEDINTEDEKNSVNGKESDGLQMYELGIDREVDFNFMKQVVFMIFDKLSESGKVKLSGFVPERALTYLLTHPLFPVTEMDNLLNSLLHCPRLFRQAVVTAPLLPCSELVDALLHQNDEIFVDVVSRIIEEFGLETISEAIRTKFARQSGNAATKKNKDSEERTNRLIECINRLIRLDVGWTILPCFVDAVGLFGWDKNTVGKLTKLINVHVQALETATENMTLIDEAIRKFSPTADAGAVAKISKSELKKLSSKAADSTLSQHPHVITEESRQREQMKGILEFGVGRSSSNKLSALDKKAMAEKKKNVARRQAQSITRRVPVYSVEKLIL